jgi:small GTP-binding protein
MVKNIKLKVIVLGDPYCGKSSILLRYQKNNFSENLSSTIGVDFFKLSLTKNDTDYTMHVWDTSGQEKFDSIIISYYRNIAVAILVFDLSNYSTFTNIKKWLENIKYYCKNKVLIKLVGNKCDKINVVSKQDINDLCFDYNINYIKVSAKDNINIDIIFNTIIDEIDSKLINCDIVPNNDNGISQIDSFKIKTIVKEHKKCCTIL